MLNPALLEKGSEQHEAYRRNGKKYFQYDYRDRDGELFSCVKKTLKDCHIAKEKWQRKKADG